jgi:xylan 1,4-beta-xylosidase
LVNGYAFWTFTDLFEEAGQFSAPFHGGYGLQTIHGIPKPTYRAFELLHKLGDERIKVEGGKDSTVEILAVKGDSSLTLLAYNHNIPGANISAEAVSLSLKNPQPFPRALIGRIDAQNANPKQEWLDLGSPEYPSQKELRQIRRASEMRFEYFNLEFKSDISTLNFIIPPHGIVAIYLNY